MAWGETERERRGVEGTESKTGSPVSSKLAKFGPREAGRDSELEPLFSAGASATRRQIRRPFHPDVLCTVLRSRGEATDTPAPCSIFYGRELYPMG
jgi:hypothetical protein